MPTARSAMGGPGRVSLLCKPGSVQNRVLFSSRSGLRLLCGSLRGKRWRVQPSARLSWLAYTRPCAPFADFFAGGNSLTPDDLSDSFQPQAQPFPGQIPLHDDSSLCSPQHLHRASRTRHATVTRRASSPIREIPKTRTTTSSQMAKRGWHRTIASHWLPWSPRQPLTG